MTHHSLSRFTYDNQRLSFASPDLITDCLHRAEVFFNSHEKFDFALPHGTGYRPFGSEAKYGNFLNPTPVRSSIYEYLHIRSTSFDHECEESSIVQLGAYDCWIRLYAILRDRAQQDFSLLGIPFGELTLRILHYPPQNTPSSFGRHLDFDYLTYVVGSMTSNRREVAVQHPNRYYIGEMAQILGHGKATPHKGAHSPDKDRYSIVAFAVPPSDYPLNPTEDPGIYFGELTVGQYLNIVLSQSREDI